MNTQLSIECEVVNQSLYDIAEKQYNIYSKRKDLAPVYLVFNSNPEANPKRKTSQYFVSYYFSKEFIEKFTNLKIIK